MEESAGCPPRAAPPPATLAATASTGQASRPPGPGTPTRHKCEREECDPRQCKQAAGKREGNDARRYAMRQEPAGLRPGEDAQRSAP